MAYCSHGPAQFSLRHTAACPLCPLLFSPSVTPPPVGDALVAQLSPLVFARREAPAFPALPFWYKRAPVALSVFSPTALLCPHAPPGTGTRRSPYSPPYRARLMFVSSPVAPVARLFRVSRFENIVVQLGKLRPLFQIRMSAFSLLWRPPMATPPSPRLPGTDL